MTATRELARELLASILNQALVVEAGTTQAVYAYRVGDFQGISPVIVVSSSGTLRQQMTARGSRGTYFLQCDIFVAYASDAWTEEDAEGLLDALEEAVAAALDVNQRNEVWQALAYVARSERIDVEVGGAEYARESLLIQVEVFGNMATHFYGMTLEQYQAFAAAASPSAANPVMMDSAVDALIAAHAALPYAHGNAGSAGIRVSVTANWATAANAWADIKAATGWNVAGDWYDVIIYLYMAYADPPRYGQFASLLAGASSPTYGVGWRVAPTIGTTVYIIGAVPSVAL